MVAIATEDLVILNLVRRIEHFAITISKQFMASALGEGRDVLGASKDMRLDVITG